MTDKQKQCLLTYLGYDTGGVDGIWGDKSISAAKGFQADYGLSRDGFFGPETEKTILKAICGGEKPIPKEPGSFWDEIRYFTRAEFRCPCGKYCSGFPVEPEEKLVRAVDEMRASLGVPVIVVPPDGHSGGSGVRCQRYNDSLPGSVPNSRHVQGKAADFSAPGVSDSAIEGYLADIKSRGVIRYWYKIQPGAYHMDVT